MRFPITGPLLRFINILQIYVILVTCCHAQEHGLDDIGRQSQASSLSPQSYAFTKYGGHQISKSTGEVSVDVPVYTYKDADFEIPIAISYQHAGFRPNDHEGVLGLGWHLQAGGAVTRIVNGVPDDSRNISGGGLYAPIDLHGMLYGIRNNLSIKTTNKDVIFSIDVGGIDIFQQWHLGGCEVEPDLFTIKAPGFHGKFLLENNGEVRGYGNKRFRVDLSGVAIQENSGSERDDVSPSSMVITTDDGYKYYFGGIMRYLEVAFTLDDDKMYGPYINAWQLTKIIAPSGRELTYQYKNFTPGAHQDEFPYDTSHYLLHFNTYRIQNADDAVGSLPGTFATSSSDYLNTLQRITKITYLEEILINGRERITFEYERKDKFYGPTVPLVNTQPQNFNQYNYRLGRIKVHDGSNNLQKQIDFTQVYYGGTFKRMFLTQLEENGATPHVFSYYDTGTLPAQTTGNIDHWGFWNAQVSNYYSAIPTQTYNANGDVTITGNQRDSNGLKSRAGMLEKITYPTGGYSKFYYEAHTYSKRLDRRADGAFRTNVYDVTGECGGVRIAKIEEHDGMSIVNSREYKYTLNYPSGGTVSSGVLMKWPRYLFYWERSGTGGIVKHLRAKGSSVNWSYTGQDNFIQYREVTEITPDNGYTNHEFTSYIDVPDYNSYDSLIINLTNYSNIYNKPLYNSYVGIRYGDRTSERGLLKRVAQYRHNGSSAATLIKEVKTTAYTGIVDYPNAYIVGVQLTGGIAQSYKQYYYPVLPKVVEETSYDEQGGNPVTVHRQYRYNAEGYVVRESTSQSGGHLLVKTTSYPSDYASGTAFIDQMVANFMLAYPIEEVQFQEAGTTRTILTGLINKYKTGAKALLDERLSLRATMPITQSSFKFSNRTTGVLPYDGTASIFSVDSRYESRALYTAYDALSNLLQYSDPSGGATYSAIWGYAGRYKLAEVSNASQQDIAFSSFETPDKGNWNYSGTPQSDATTVSGEYCYLLSTGAINRSGLTAAKRYIVSYWRKGGSSSSVSVTGVSSTLTGMTISGWTFEQKIVEGVSSISISGSINLDELRLHPIDAAMSTYTYKPVVGVMTYSDPAGRLFRYEYDSHNRLKRIRDLEGNVLEEYDYHFKNQ